MPDRPAKLINLTSIQIKYKQDWKHRFLIVSAGRRSRKTLIGRRKILIKAVRHPNHKYFHAAPTRIQAKEIFWENMKKDYAFCMSKKSETELKITLVNGTTVVVVGLDVPERIEGQTPSWNGCHITEFPNLKDNAFEQHVYPALSDENAFGIFDGVPEGRNHYYDMALKACNGVIPKTVPIKGAFGENKEWAFYTWFTSDVQEPAIIEQARIDLDPRTFQQEYEGQFVDYAGLAYYAYGEHNLRKCIYDPNRRISIGMDFNVSPMTCVIGHIVSDTYYQFDERYMLNSNTFEICDEISEHYPKHMIDVYPDSTGSADESNASKSDIDILNRSGFRVLARSVNPRQKDRINTVNSRAKKLENGKSRYYVNPAKCPKTINDMNKVVRLEDGRFDKKQEEQGLKHITDGLGYLFCYNWPMRDGVQML